jgi:hypothetical protein
MTHADTRRRSLNSTETSTVQASSVSNLKEPSMNKQNDLRKYMAIQSGNSEDRSMNQTSNIAPN